MIFDMKDSTKKLFGIFIYLIILLVIGVFVYEMIQKFSGANKDAKVLGQQEVVIGDLTASNEQLRTAIDNKAKADGIDKLTVQDNIVKKQTNAELKDSEHALVEKKVLAIKKDYNAKISQTTDPQVNVQLMKEKEAAVSKTRIMALWTNYCKYETQQPECKELFP